MTAPLTGRKMAIFSVYVVNKAGGLIYQYDNYVPRAEVEKTFSFPLDLVLKIHDEKAVVSFGQRDGIRGACLYVSANHPMYLYTLIGPSLQFLQLFSCELCNMFRVYFIYSIFSRVQWVMRFCPLTGWM